VTCSAESFAGRPYEGNWTAAVLVERPASWLPKSDLVARVWLNIHVEVSNLKVHIAVLRRALGKGEERIAELCRWRGIASSNGRYGAKQTHRFARYGAL
jgi:hypothetical protein